jgi:hypothetical protein
MTDTYRAPTIPRLAWQDRDQPKPTLRVVAVEKTVDVTLFRPRSSIREKMFPRAKPIATAITRSTPKVFVIYPEDFGPKHPLGETVWMAPLNGKVQVARIVAAASMHFKVSRNDILSERRSVHVVRARQVAFYVAKLMSSHSVAEISRRIGDRDHTTGLHAIKKIERLMRTDPTVYEDVHAVVALVLNGSNA